MRVWFFIVFIALLAGCDYERTYVIEIPDDPVYKAEMCRHGVVYTIDKDEDVAPRLRGNGEVQRCMHAPQSMDDFHSNERWKKEGMLIEFSPYKHLVSEFD